jgi:iron complex transport system substrate-binding protein
MVRLARGVIRMSRPNLRAWFAALLLAITLVSDAGAVSFTDAAGRVVEVPADGKRIMAAGPPAAVLLYALAPQKMAGWVRRTRRRRSVDAVI